MPFPLNKILVLAGMFLLVPACSDSEPKAKAFSNSASKAGKMNISCFAYRDINRNGTYDMGDRPYAGLVVSLKSPNDTDQIRKSNIGGFTNFKMSKGNNAYPISVPGQYKIYAQPPGGWEITSDNNTQVLNIKELAGSPAGLIAEQTLQPVGVAPTLSIYGQLDLNQWDQTESITINASKAGAEAITSNPDSEGRFSIPVSKGTWSIEISDSSGASHNRVVEVDSYAVRLSGITVNSDYGAKSAPITSIDFDTLTHSDTLFEIPNGFAGLDWHNWISTHQKLYKGSGYINATTSGEYLAYNSSGHPASISSDLPFDLLQLNIGVAWAQAEKGDITITAWRGDEIVYKDVFRGSIAGPLVFAANYLGVTQVDFATENYWQLVIDDLVIRK